ncbi:hypothetical protein H5410_049939 [Solanum commersonii]|uniref:Uncharacterized protein n=1 Tax=Solanum commersonii TaxID=4109 RepID=A0A9J5WWF6_SOLCO|nr:hypothetical protein H5410_049939 [Solanum commersonii]
MHMELSSNGLISLSFGPFKEQLADIFTKPLHGLQHHGVLCKLGLTPLPSTLRGDVGIQPSSPASSQPLIACANFTREKMKMSDDVLFEKSKWAKSDIGPQKKTRLGSAWN